jgi:hypothetical protein
MKLKIGMRVLEQHASVVIKGAMQHAAELLLSNIDYKRYRAVTLSPPP